MRLFLLAACLASCGVSAYELRRDSTGEIVRWPGSVEFVLDSKMAARMGEKEALDAIATAAANLSEFSPGLRLTLRTGAANEVGYDFGGSAANQNSIVTPDAWPYEENAIAVTVVTVDTRTHHIIDADIAFNTHNRKFKVLSILESTKDTVEFDDVQNTVTHELGHALGLAHNPEDPEVVMYPSARRGEIKKRTIAEDDAAGLAHLYPEGQYFENSATQAFGCQASAVASAPFAWPWLMLLLCLRRKTWAHFSILLLVPLGASASSVERQDAPVNQAWMAGTFRVLRAQTLRPEKSKLLHTRLEITLRECLKGTCPKVQTLEVPGGRWEHLEQWIDGMQVPKEGEILGVTFLKEGTSFRIYRLETLRDFTAFAQGLKTAGLSLTPREQKKPDTTQQKFDSAPKLPARGSYDSSSTWRPHVLDMSGL